MSGEQRKEPDGRDYEEIGPIARKVLADAKRAMEERKRLAGEDLGRQKFTGQQRWSPTAEKCGSPELKRSAMLDGLPQSTPQWEESGDRTGKLGEEAGGLVCGQVHANRQSAGPRGGTVSVVTTPCPRTDANEVAGGFTVLRNNARR